MQIDSLSEAQKQVIQWTGQGRPIPRRFSSSVKALKGNGYLTDAGALTAAGRALLDEEPQRRQTTAAFQAGDRVEYSHWIQVNGFVTHEWQPGIVEKKGKQALKLKMANGLPKRCYARNARKVG